MFICALMTVLELQPLEDLRSWPTCAQRILALQAALQGSDSVSADEISTLRVWSLRWTRLHPSLRSFYASHAGCDERVGAALWHVLEAKRPSVAVWVAVRAAWMENQGVDPWLELIPDYAHLGA